MTLTGVTTNNVDNKVAVSDQVLVNRDGSTAVQDTSDLATQLAASGPISDALSVANIGARWKSPVRVILATNVSLATLISGATADGVTFAANDRFALAGQTNAAENGIYVISSSGAPTRAADADTASEVLAMAFSVREGTSANKQFVCTATGAITLGTTALPIVEMSDLNPVTSSIDDRIDNALTDFRVVSLNPESGFILACVDATGQILYAVETNGRMVAHLSEHTIFPQALMDLVNASGASLTTIACWGDSLTDGAGGGGTNYPSVLASTLSRSVYEGGVGGETSTQVKDRVLADVTHRDWTCVFWMGRNNYAAPQTVVSDILACIDHLTPSAPRVLVLSVLNGDYSTTIGDTTDEWLGGAEYEEIKDLNDELALTFGTNFIDIRRYLIDFGLRDAGIAPTMQDQTDITHDVVPSSLRFDKLHLNSAGYSVVGNYVARLIRGRHW